MHLAHAATRLALVFVLSLLTVAGYAAETRPEAAVVARLQGSASVEGVAVQQGSTLASGQRLTTGKGARLQLLFADGTDVVLGEDADFTIAAFTFSPDSNSGEARLQVSAGAFLITTGKIAKLPGRPLSVATPVASIGVRGTRFWGGNLDHPLDVLLLDGAITVRSQGGSVDLEHPLEGTDVAAANAAPSPAGRWKQPRIDKALRSVDFN